jgi:putative glutamine amidotransferase
LAACGADCDALYLPAYGGQYDALLLTGGEDVDPALYGRDNTACHGIDRDRDRAEIALVRAFLAAGKPVFGICRGQQLINVALGGTLIQDLPTAEGHSDFGPGGADRIHPTRAASGSFVADIYGGRFVTNSSHHQGIDRLAPDLVAVQWADDGVIEACRHRSAAVYSVQWHPERMCLKYAREDTVDGAGILRWFVKTASGA